MLVQMSKYQTSSSSSHLHVIPCQEKGLMYGLFQFQLNIFFIFVPPAIKSVGGNKPIIKVLFWTSYLFKDKLTLNDVARWMISNWNGWINERNTSEPTTQLIFAQFVGPFSISITQWHCCNIHINNTSGIKQYLQGSSVKPYKGSIKVYNLAFL